MKMAPIDSFEIPELGYTFVDFQNASLEDRRAALWILRGLLQDIIRDARPEMDGLPSVCNANPLLGSKNFLVYEGDEIRGTFNIYDVEEEGGFVASAAPGVMAAPGLSIGETWGVIMRWMLENIVDAWVFPGDTNYEWHGADVPDEVVLELSTSGHIVILREDGTPERIDRAS